MTYGTTELNPGTGGDKSLKDAITLLDGAAARYLKLYNKATAPTVGTDTPVIVIPIPAGQVVKIDGGSNGIRFGTGTGIGWALTASAADSDTTAVSANEHKVAIAYT